MATPDGKPDDESLMKPRNREYVTCIDNKGPFKKRPLAGLILVLNNK